MKRRTELLAALLAVAAGASSFAPGEAQAYCRMTSCPETKGPGQACEPRGEDDCGTPLSWERECVGFSLQRDASSAVPLSKARDVLAKAFNTWVRASCGGAESPSIGVQDIGPADCDEVEYSTDKANANVIVFRDEAWPHDDDSVLALTTVTYSLSSGEIYDADMEVNTADHRFTTDDASPDIDLLSVATHEAGHFLGLAHSPDETSTMFAAYTPGTLGQRSLAPDDVQAICAAYPPGDGAHGACDPTPRHGFSPLCAADQKEASSGEGGSGGSGGEDGDPDDGGSGGSKSPAALACAVSPGSEGGGDPFAWALSALAAIGALRRSRRG